MKRVMMEKSLKAVVLGAATTALIASGAISIPANAAPGDKATITVSRTSGLNPDGETITITGSGFLENAPLTSGTRLPLNGTFSGFYVSFGKFQDTWEPSTGAPIGNRKAVQNDGTRTKWLVPAANLASIGGVANGGAELATDGTFTVTLNVSKILLNSSKTLVFDETTIGNYGIYTYGASGANYAPFETYTPILFAQKVEEAISIPLTPAVPVATLGKTISKRVIFAGGKSSLAATTKRDIKKEVPNYKLASKVTITATAGSTVGASDKVARSLAKKRANAIKKYLVAQGVPAEKIVIKTKVSKSGKKPSTKVVATP
jgi:hypothetical protein